jgi:hypothetical protein
MMKRGQSDRRSLLAPVGQLRQRRMPHWLPPPGEVIPQCSTDFFAALGGTDENLDLCFATWRRDLLLGR